mmetsp:Transcript_33707/g.103437  ORF Transcript_33707/g.103437 Transcript_33707/m.103437 type:complete len:360 (+) Transcript_33707:590-1669(+)
MHRSLLRDQRHHDVARAADARPRLGRQVRGLAAHARHLGLHSERALWAPRLPLGRARRRLPLRRHPAGSVDRPRVLRQRLARSARGLGRGRRLVRHAVSARGAPRVLRVGLRGRADGHRAALRLLRLELPVARRHHGPHGYPRRRRHRVAALRVAGRQPADVVRRGHVHGLPRGVGARGQLRDQVQPHAQRRRRLDVRRHWVGLHALRARLHHLQRVVASALPRVGPRRRRQRPRRQHDEQDHHGPAAPERFAGRARGVVRRGRRAVARERRERRRRRRAAQDVRGGAVVQRRHGADGDAGRHGPHELGRDRKDGLRRLAVLRPGRHVDAGRGAVGRGLVVHLDLRRAHALPRPRIFLI